MLREVEIVLDDVVRPHLMSHNGNIKVINVTDDGIVNVKLSGACSGCPHSDVTTKDFIEEKLSENLSWFKEIKISREVSEDIMDLARKILSN